MRDIATRAGVDQALFFRYFGSEEALFEEVAAGHHRAATDAATLVADMLDNLLDPPRPRGATRC